MLIPFLLSGEPPVDPPATTTIRFPLTGVVTLVYPGGVETSANLTGVVSEVSRYSGTMSELGRYGGSVDESSRFTGSVV